MADWIKKAATEWLVGKAPDGFKLDPRVEISVNSLAEVIARNVPQPQPEPTFNDAEAWLAENFPNCPKFPGYSIIGMLAAYASERPRVVPQGSASEPIDENAEYQKWWNAQTLKGDPAKIPNKCRAGWNARAELAARNVPQSPKVLEISESDLRGVFGHKCDQPDCPVCNPKGAR